MMNDNNFFFTIDKINDKFIAEAASAVVEENDVEPIVEPIFVQPVEKRKNPLFAIGLTAACFALVFGVGIMLRNGTSMEVTQDPLNSAETTEPKGMEITDENGNGYILLFGEPMSSDKLKAFDYEETYLDTASRYEAMSEFFDNIDIPDKEEIKELYYRGIALISVLKGDSLIDQSLINDEFYRVRLVVLDDLKTNELFKYFETGISYESFYNALSAVFTEDVVNGVSCGTAFTAWVCPFGYNNEVWARIGKAAPDENKTFGENRLVKSTDTELVFQTIFYREKTADSAEFDPEKEYITTENSFVKTDKGWKIKNIYSPLYGYINPGDLVREVVDEYGNTLTLYGVLTPEESLTDFDYEQSYKFFSSNASEVAEFFDGLDIPNKDEIKELYFRGVAINAVRDSPLIRNTGTGIKVENEFGPMMYFETGIKFDSFYNALSQVFEKNTAAEVLPNVGGLRFYPYPYNNELWLQGGTPAYDVRVVHSDYRLAEYTADRLIIEETLYKRDVQTMEGKYEPDKKDQYETETVENIFVKTKYGWRIKELYTVWGYICADKGFSDVSDTSNKLDTVDLLAAFEKTIGEVKTVEELNSAIKEFDKGNQVREVKVYKNSTEYKNNGVPVSEGALESGMYVYVAYDEVSYFEMTIA